MRKGITYTCVPLLKTVQPLIWSCLLGGIRWVFLRVNMVSCDGGGGGRSGWRGGVHRQSKYTTKL